MEKDLRSGGDYSSLGEGGKWRREIFIFSFERREGFGGLEGVVIMFFCV